MGLVEHVGQDGQQVVDQLDILHMRLGLGEVVLHADHVGVHSVGIEHRLHGQKIQKLYAHIEHWSRPYRLFNSELYVCICVRMDVCNVTIYLCLYACI